MNFSSSAFTNMGKIPTKYTCEGENISPDLSWLNVPSGTKSLALICEDPDAPAKVWTHWVAYNIDPKISILKEGEDLSKIGILQGMNDSDKKNSYSGPCPPIGHGTHHYHFQLYALDTKLDLKSGATKEKLLASMKGHILAQAELIGTYERRK